MKKTLLLTAIVTLGLSGCATQKNWGAAGGSKADGTVKLAYSYGQFEAPTTDKAQANAVALQRCKAWGYTNAVPFDFVNSTCQQASTAGCQRTMVTQEYQCE